MPFIGDIHRKLDEILVGITNIRSQNGALRMSTQQDAENLAQAIAANTAAFKSWATNVVTILGNVETALTNAQNANPSVDLSDAQTALTDAQNVVGALPVETDPTNTPPAPAPTPAPGS